MLQAADRLLSILLAIGSERVRYSAASEALEELASVGVITLTASSVPDCDEDVMPELSADDTRFIPVDARQVLRETVERSGFTVGEETQGFVELHRSGLPAGCAVYFLLRNSPALYAIRALSKASALIVLHVNDDIEDARENMFLHTLGVHAARLRTLEAMLSPGALESLVEMLQAAFSVASTALGEVPSPALVPQIDPERRELSEADPLLLPIYASTCKDRLFEEATARVLDAMFQWHLPLGIAFSGRTVPDGVVFRGRNGPSNPQEVAHYDCKSKSTDSYSLSTGDGDQQGRYLGIQRRLEAERGWRGRGVLMFTPAVEPDVIAGKTQKDAWARVLVENRELIFIPAQVTHRWWELQRLEATWQLKAFVSPALIWAALFDFKLEGIGTDVAQRLFPSSRNSARLLNVADAELIWIAGLHGFPPDLDAVTESLQSADREARIEEKLRLPALVTRFVDALAKKDSSLDSIMRATGLHAPAVEYLLQSRPMSNRWRVDTSPYLSASLLRLRGQVEQSA
ncbi:hypothetical protein D7X99_10890 [Corallococcus sp. AB032C]|nr:hypothetical protein D7X99_10890 [Corallococcus sp. AB032C]